VLAREWSFPLRGNQRTYGYAEKQNFLSSQRGSTKTCSRPGNIWNSKRIAAPPSCGQGAQFVALVTPSVKHILAELAKG
jgi:hypothetical protein